LENEFEKINQINPLPSHIKKTVYALLKCRTPEYGGHLYACPDEHYAVIHFNSCKKRNCPTCQGAEIKYWEAVQKERMLNTGHYHIVFKNPVQMNSDFIRNYKMYANLLMDVSRDTIKEMFGKGIQSGAIAILHTHGKNNEIHPHVHLAVTDGGSDSNLEYKTIPDDLLNPVVMSQLFNKIYVRKLKHRITGKKIFINSEDQLELFKSISVNTGNVFCSKKYATSEFLIKYLAKFSKGGAIKNYNISSITDGIVTYISEDKDRNKVTRRLSIETFIRRFLYHIPPEHFKVIRYFGLYASGASKNYNSIRGKLKQDKYEKPVRSELRDEDSPTCPVCQKKLLHIDSFNRNTLPEKLNVMFKNNPDNIRDIFFKSKEAYKGIKILFDKIPHINKIVAKRIA
jgi:hypothetical protein